MKFSIAKFKFQRKLTFVIFLSAVSLFTALSVNGSTIPLADNVSFSCSGNSVSFSVFDPVRGSIKTGGFISSNSISNCNKYNGMVVWLERVTQQFVNIYKVNYSVYDITRGIWVNGFYSTEYTSPQAFGAAGGLLIWVDAYRDLSNNLIYTRKFATYDVRRGYWTSFLIDKASPYASDAAGAFDMFAVRKSGNGFISSIVQFLAYNQRSGFWMTGTSEGDTYTQVGFDTFNHRFVWNYNGQTLSAGLIGNPGYFILYANTVPLADFVFFSPNKAATPAQTIFWDLSVGASSLSWNFGDNSSSSARTPTHNFGKGFFTIEQTALTPLVAQTFSIQEVFGYLNPIDEPRFFVLWQYRDFLEREPDQGGWDFWTGKITQCGSDANCINQQRIAVSKAFFLSEEFRITGSYTYLLHVLTYGTNQDFLPNFNTFTTDRRLVVASGQTDLAHGVVRRNDFRNRYPNYLSNSAFVDSVFNYIQNVTGFTYPVNERQQFYQINGVDQLDTRLLVIKAIANDSQVLAAARNRTFVTTEYFGYLRRTPDLGGFRFWLNILDSDPTNENGMVCAFITSKEYQQRFSPNITRTNSDCGGMPDGPNGGEEYPPDPPNDPPNDPPEDPWIDY